MVDFLFVRGSTVSSQLRSQTALLSPSRVLFVDVLPMLKGILSPRSDALLTLTEGQKSGLELLSTYTTAYRRSAIDKNCHDDGFTNEATLIKNMTRNCYAKHKPKNQEEGADLLLRIGGQFNEILKEDDIEDFDD